MTVDETRQVINGFLDSLAGHWLAEDVDLYDSARSQHYWGRAEVTTWFASRYPTRERAVLLVDEGHAVVELQLRSTPAGPGVPTATVYEVRAGEIVGARLYYDWTALHGRPADLEST